MIFTSLGLELVRIRELLSHMVGFHYQTSKFRSNKYRGITRNVICYPLRVVAITRYFGEVVSMLQQYPFQTCVQAFLSLRKAGMSKFQGDNTTF